MKKKIKILLSLFLILILQASESFAIDSSYNTWIESVDQTPFELIISSNENYYWPALYNDKIFFTRFFHSMNSDIRTIPSSGGVEEDFFSSVYIIKNLSISPFTGNFVFVSNRDDSRGNIYFGSMEEKTDKPKYERVTYELGYEDEPAVGWNTSVIAWISNIDNKNLYIMYPLQGTTRFLDSDASCPSFSFGDSLIVYISSKNRQKQLAIYNLNNNSIEYTNLLGIDEPISPLFTNNNKNIIFANSSDGSLYVFDVESGEYFQNRFISNEISIREKMFFNPKNNRILAFASSQEGRGLYSINPLAKDDFPVADNISFQYLYAKELSQKPHLHLLEKVDAFKSVLNNFVFDSAYYKKAIMGIIILYIQENNIEEAQSFLYECSKLYRDIFVEIYFDYIKLGAQKGIDIYSEIELLKKHFEQFDEYEHNYTATLDFFSLVNLYNKTGIINTSILDSLKHHISTDAKEFAEFISYSLFAHFYNFEANIENIKALAEYLDNVENSYFFEQIAKKIENFRVYNIFVISNQITKKDRKEVITKIFIRKSVESSNNPTLEFNDLINLVESKSAKSSLLTWFNSYLINYKIGFEYLTDYLLIHVDIPVDSMAAVYMKNVLSASSVTTLSRYQTEIFRNIAANNPLNIRLWQLFIDLGGNADVHLTNTKYIDYYKSYYRYNRFTTSKNSRDLDVAYTNIYKFYLNNPRDLNGLLLYAVIYEKMGDLNQRASDYRKGLDIYSFMLEFVNSEYLPVIYYNMAMLHTKLDNQMRASSYFVQALNSGLNFSSKEQEGIFYYYLAKIFSNTGNHDIGLDYLRKSRAILFQYSNLDYVMEINRMFVYIFQMMNQPDSVSRYISSIIRTGIGSERQIAKAYSNEAISYLFSGDEGLAYESASRSQVMLEGLTEKEFFWDERVKVGIVFPVLPTLRLSKIGKARYKFDIFDEKALVNSVKWQFYKSSGRVDLGLVDLYKKLEISYEKNDYLMTAITYNNLGYSYKIMGDTQKTQNYLTKSYEICSRYYFEDEEFMEGFIVNIYNLIEAGVDINRLSVILSDIQTAEITTVITPFNRNRLKLARAMIMASYGSLFSNLQAYNILRELIDNIGDRNYRLKALAYNMLIHSTPFEDVKESYISDAFSFFEKVAKESWINYFNVLYGKGEFYDDFTYLYNQMRYYDQLPPFFSKNLLKKAVKNYLETETDTVKIITIFEMYKEFVLNLELSGVRLNFDTELMKNRYLMMRNYYKVFFNIARDSLTYYSILEDSAKIKQFENRIEHLKEDQDNYLFDEFGRSKNSAIVSLFNFNKRFINEIRESKNNVIYIINDSLTISASLNAQLQDTIFIPFNIEDVSSAESLGNIFNTSYLNYMLFSQNSVIVPNNNKTFTLKTVHNTIADIGNTRDVVFSQNLIFFDNAIYTKWKNRRDEIFFLEAYENFINVRNIDFEALLPNAEINSAIFSRLFQIKEVETFTITTKNSSFVIGRFLESDQARLSQGEELLIQEVLLGREYMQRGEYIVASKKFLQAKNIMELIELTQKHQYGVLFSLSESYYRSQQFNQAKDELIFLYDSLLAISDKEEDDYSKIIQVSNLLSMVYSELDNATVSFKFLETMQGVAQTLNNQRLEANIMYRMATSLIDLQQYDRGTQYINRSANIFLELGETQRYTFLKRQIARIYMEDIGLMHQAEREFLNLIEFEEDTSSIFVLYLELSGVYTSLGDFVKASQMLKNAYDLREHAQDLSLYYHFLAQMYFYRGDIDNFKKNLFKVEIEQSENDKKSNIYYLGFLVPLKIFENKIGAADSINRIILNIVNTDNNHRTKRGVYYINQGWIEYRKGNHELGLELIKEAVEFDKNNNTTKELILDYKHLIIYSYYVGETAPIEGYYRKFIEMTSTRTDFLRYRIIVEYYHLLANYNKLSSREYNRIRDFILTNDPSYEWRVAYVDMLRDSRAVFLTSQMRESMRNDNWNRTWNWNFNITWRDFYKKSFSYAATGELETIYSLYKKDALFFSGFDKNIKKRDLTYENLAYAAVFDTVAFFIENRKGNYSLTSISTSLINTTDTLHKFVEQNYATTDFGFVPDRHLWKIDNIKNRINFTFPFIADFSSFNQQSEADNIEKSIFIKALAPYIPSNIIICDKPQTGVNESYNRAVFLIDQSLYCDFGYAIESKLLNSNGWMIALTGENIAGYLFIKQWYEYDYDISEIEAAHNKMIQLYSHRNFKLNKIFIGM